jgi:hypothetical protein
MHYNTKIQNIVRIFKIQNKITAKTVYTTWTKLYKKKFIILFLMLNKFSNNIYIVFYF